MKHFIIALFFVSTAHAEYKAEVIHVSDGDTVTIVDQDKARITIRLSGIDSPEKGQAYGGKAKAFMKDLIYKKTVTVFPLKKGKYGRTIATVITPDGQNVSHEMLKAGLTWWFYKYSKDAYLGGLEVQAKRSRTGLWEDSLAIPPWVYRKANRNYYSKLGGKP